MHVKSSWLSQIYFDLEDSVSYLCMEGLEPQGRVVFPDFWIQVHSLRKSQEGGGQRFSFRILRPSLVSQNSSDKTLHLGPRGIQAHV